MHLYRTVYSTKALQIPFKNFGKINSEPFSMKNK